MRSTAGKPRRSCKGEGFNVVCFDLETTNLNADFGVVLCGAFWRQGMKAPRVLSQRRLNPDWAMGARRDRDVIEALSVELKSADFWVAHNGGNFDVPFLYARAAYWGIEMPPKRAIMDPVVLARRHFKLSGNSLERLGKFFHLAPKTPLDPDDWLRASLDRDDAAMRRIERHCQRDVELLQSLAPHFRPYWKSLAGAGVFV